jgi:hypothetical protein
MKFWDYVNKTLLREFKKYIRFRVAITFMYPPIPWELVTDPSGQGTRDHTLTLE